VRSRRCDGTSVRPGDCSRSSTPWPPVRLRPLSGDWYPSAAWFEAGKAHSHDRSARADEAVVASGWSDAEIAERLSIAPTTVKSHVSNILAKIGAHARVQAVAFAYESGLMRPAV
jgi:DNA-binding CsgD family transcriptional regulator